MSPLQRPCAGFLLLAALLPACEGEPASAPQLDQERVDQLRALGYTGFSDEIVDPAQSGVILADPARSAPGYTLITSGHLALAELVDLRGDPVHAWRGEDGELWSNAEILSDGSLIVPARRRGRLWLLRLAWEGGVLWRAGIRSHHDAEQLPDGRIVTLTNRKRRIPAISTEVDVRDHGIALLDSHGELLEEASLYDLLATRPALFRFQRVARMEEKRGDVIDLLHSNSVEFMRHPELAERSPLYAAGNVLVSIRHQDTIAIFDWGARRLLWAWGQGELSGQHDATVLENGNILVFDNGLEPMRSRVVELDPESRRIVWEYQAPQPGDFFSVRKGSSQRLANGNTLVANSDSGEAFELTAAGESVWHYKNPRSDDEGHRATIVRVKRYPSEFIEKLLEGAAPGQ